LNSGPVNLAPKRSAQEGQTVAGHRLRASPPSSMVHAERRIPLLKQPIQPVSPRLQRTILTAGPFQPLVNPSPVHRLFVGQWLRLAASLRLKAITSASSFNDDTPSQKRKGPNSLRVQSALSAGQTHPADLALEVEILPKTRRISQWRLFHY
jgi:hypothetical protein